MVNMIGLQIIEQPLVVTVARGTLACVFLMAGASKLPNQRRLAYIAIAFNVLPRRLAESYAFWLPWLELTVGFSLLLGLAPRIGAGGGALLLISFTFALALNIVRKRRLDCGCFGSRRTHDINGGMIVRNIVLLTLAASILWGAKSYLELDDLFPPAVPFVHLAESAQVLCVVLVIAVAVLFVSPLIAQICTLLRTRTRYP